MINAFNDYYADLTGSMDWNVISPVMRTNCGTILPWNLWVVVDFYRTNYLPAVP